MTAAAPTFRYDLFFVCAGLDRAFVQGEVLRRLEWAEERVLLLGDFTPGASMNDEIERGVSQSRFTLVVLSRAFLADRWATFGEQLASYSNTMKGRLVPILREACEVPVRLQFLVALDYSDPAQHEAETLRLRRLLGAAASSVEPLAIARRHGLPAPSFPDHAEAALSLRIRLWRKTFFLSVSAAGAVALSWTLFHRGTTTNLKPVDVSSDDPPGKGPTIVANPQPDPTREVPAPAAPPGEVRAEPRVIAGTVVDARTNRGISKARVEIEGQPSSTRSDDSGNFRETLPRTSAPQERVLLRVSKQGYKVSERWLWPPVDDLVLPLTKE